MFLVANSWPISAYPTILFWHVSSASKKNDAFIRSNVRSNDLDATLSRGLYRSFAPLIASVARPSGNVRIDLFLHLIDNVNAP